MAQIHFSLWRPGEFLCTLSLLFWPEDGQILFGEAVRESNALLLFGGILQVVHLLTGGKQLLLNFRSRGCKQTRDTRETFILFIYLFTVSALHVSYSGRNKNDSGPHEKPLFYVEKITFVFALHLITLWACYIALVIFYAQCM